MKVKICGITNKDDAVWAINYGADYIGLNFYKESPRHVSLVSAGKWVPELPSFAALVGVFVDSSVDDIVKSVQKLKLKGIQLHGQETPAFISELKVNLDGAGLSPFVMKAIRVDSEESLAQLDEFKEVVDYILLDAKVDGELGGTGKSFDWAIAEKANQIGKPVFLAGGLKPENVKQAVKKAKPFAVDVASGVEKTPRKKDTNRIRDFISSAKG